MVNSVVVIYLFLPTCNFQDMTSHLHCLKNSRSIDTGKPPHFQFFVNEFVYNEFSVHDVKDSLLNMLNLFRVKHVPRDIFKTLLKVQTGLLPTK